MGRQKSGLLKLLTFLLITLTASVSFAGTQPLDPRHSLVLSAAGDPKSFNELTAQETSTTEITGLIFEGLTRFNSRTQAMEGRLAERWDISGDGLTYTFFLRPGILWSDGSPFTSRDILFTFNELIYNPAIINAAADVFTLGGKKITVEVLDEQTVRFILPRPFAPFLMAMSQSIYPQHKLQDFATKGTFMNAWGIDTSPDEIIGTGPFRLSRYVPGERIELIRNQNYWMKDVSGNRLPLLEGILYLIIPSPDGRLLKFLEGETDAFGVSGTDYPLIKEKEREGKWNLYEAGPSLGSNFFVFNQNPKDPVKRSWFTNLVFRKAVAHSFDRDSMNDIVFNRLGVKQCSPLSPSTPFFYNSQVVCYDFDPEKSKALLFEENFKDRNDDGWIEDAEGHTVEFVLITNAENSERIQLAGMVRSDLEKIGIKVHFLSLEFNSIVSRLVATYDWDAVLMGLTGELDPHFGSSVWRSEGSLHFWNPAQTSPATDWEARIDRIFDAGSSETGFAARKELYDEWQQIISRELPMIYTVLPKVVFAVKDRFEGLNPTVLGGPFDNIEKISIKE